MVLSHKELEESERNFRDLIIQAPIGICIVTSEPFYMELANDCFLQLAGKERSEFEQKPFLEVLKEAEAYYALYQQRKKLIRKSKHGQCKEIIKPAR